MRPAAQRAARRHAFRPVAALLLAVTLGAGACAPAPSRTPGPGPTGGASPGASPETSSVAAAPTCGPTPPLVPPPGLGQPGWWQDRVFYEVFVRSFADANGDGIGDLAGLTAHLDALNDGDPATTTDLGVTALWLMPTFPSPSYHGYDVTDYTGVNRDYGSLDDLRALVAAAHRRGMAVILDLPVNHTSAKNPWFVASETGAGPYADWYRWAASPQGLNWQQDPNGRFYYAAFGPDFPDLNLVNPDVTAEITRDATFWLTDVGVDGFRLDAAKYLIEDGTTLENTPETHAWWQTFRTAIDTTTPGALTLGEVWDTPQNSSSYVPADLDLTFDFALAGAYVSAAQSGDASGLGKVLAKLATLYPPVAGYGAFLTNHDIDRVASQLSADPAKERLAADLLLTGPGVPFIYYGEEIGMTGAKPDERIRTPMRWDASPTAGFTTGTPWEALSSDPSSVNVADESADPQSLLSHYRDLIRLRAAHPALSVGTYIPVTSDQPGVFAAIRAAPRETALVVTNASASPVAPVLSLAAGPLCGNPSATIVLGGSGVTTAAAPIVTAAGGFADYRPLEVIPARTAVVIDLAP